MGARGIVGWRESCIVFFTGLILSGCAIHPLPEDVTGVKTYIIVRQIRCETRQAAIDAMFNYLTDPYNISHNKVDAFSYNLGQRLKEAYDRDHDSITKFDPARLTGEANKIVGLLYHTGVAYNYDLLGVETNNVDPVANFIRPLPTSSLVTVGVTGNFDRQRQNDRSFTITDTLGGLIRNVHQDYCQPYMADENYIYPIAGKVGVSKVVRDFLLLALFANLSAESKDSKTVTNISGPPTMVEQLQFITTIGGTATPKITFAQIGPALQVSDASIGVTMSRKDTHQLTVGLYLDTTAAKQIAGIRAGLFRGTFITASGGAAEQGAAKAVEQFLALKIFKPMIVVGQ